MVKLKSTEILPVFTDIFLLEHYCYKQHILIYQNVDCLPFPFKNVLRLCFFHLQFLVAYFVVFFFSWYFIAKPKRLKIINHKIKFC